MSSQRSVSSMGTGAVTPAESTTPMLSPPSAAPQPVSSPSGGSSSSAPQKSNPGPKPQRRPTYPFSSFYNTNEARNKEQPSSDRVSLSHQPKLNEEEIFQFATRYKSFEFRNYQFKELPKYDDLTGFGIPETEEHRLWKLEIRRLLDVVKADGPIFFKCDGRSDILGSADGEGFKKVMDLCDQIACNMCIIYHDNSLVDRSDKRERDKKRFYTASRDTLQLRLAESPTTDEENVRAKRPELLPDGNREAYFALVDYLTAILARYLYRCATSRLWHNQSFCILAKWAAKLKVLEKDPVDFARLSLEAAEDLDDEQEQTSYLDFIERRLPSRLLAESAEPYDPSSLYHSVELQFRDVLHYQVQKVVDDAFRKVYHKKHPQAMEVCTRVYRTGKKHSHTIIASDKAGQYNAATDAKQLRYSRAAFDILLKDVEDIQRRQAAATENENLNNDPEKDAVAGQAPNPDGSPTDVKSLGNTLDIEWRWSVQEQQQRPLFLRHSPEGSIKTSSMSDALSVLLLHSLCDAHVSIETMMLIFVTRLAGSLLEDETVTEYVDEDFTCEFSCTTSAQKMLVEQLRIAKDTFSLKNASVFQKHILPGARHMESGAPDPPAPSFLGRLKRHKTSLATFEENMKRTEAWMLDEKAVIVPCKRYVYTCLTIAILIIGGGLAIPFTTRVRLPGVDPFNIASFAWLFAIFFLLVAQSRYVPEWKWHDFLHGRIVCRTVSELASVSGLSAQLVLHRLLTSEKSSALSTRGPYNGMFTHKSDDGFSIDVPCLTSTLYASGFVLILGVGKFDRHVVCYDARPVSLLLQARHNDDSSKESLGCALPLDAQADTSKLPVVKMAMDEFMTERVLGLYMGDREFG